MTSTKRKIKGEQGSWFAAVNGYEDEGIPNGTKLPCVHHLFFKRIGTIFCHDEPWDAPYANWPESRLAAYLEGIKRGFVIITKNEWPPDIDPENNPKGITGKRVAYSGVYTVKEARIEEGRLRFEYVRNLESSR